MRLKNVVFIMVTFILAAGVLFYGDVSAAGVITDLSVNTSVNKSDFWSVQSNLQIGNTAYADRTYTFTAIPQELLGGEWIQPAFDSKSTDSAVTTAVTFKVRTDSTVYIAHSAGIVTKPQWLAAGSWTLNSGAIVQSGSGTSYSIYKKTFAANSVISLGNNNSASYGYYFVIVKSNVSDDARLKNITIGGEAINNFLPDVNSYNCELPYGTFVQNLPVVSAFVYQEGARTTIVLPDDLPGTATIHVVAEDNLTTKSYTIAFTVEDRCTVTTRGFEKNGQPVTDLWTGDITCKVAVTNNDRSAVPVIMFVVLLDGNAMETYDYQMTELAPGAVNQELLLPIHVPDDGKSYTLKIFLWNQLETFEPIFEGAVID